MDQPDLHRSIALEEKVSLLFRANQAALRVRGVRFVASALSFLREDKLFANGRVAYPVKNLRWNESPVFMLNHLEAMGGPVRVSPSESSDLSSAVVVPPIKVSAFTFTSISDAV